jgi:DNA-binding beta-propeller fold protein YncE
VPRSRTSIVVADPTGEVEPRRYDLRGNFEPEAFSSDDTRLFLIQYLPAEAPEVYRVTVLDLDAGRVGSVAGRFKSPPERMPGIRLSQVLAPDAEQLYTLYSNHGAGYGWNGAGEADAVTFVHVLNLQRGWAFCAGLPEELWGQPARAQAMAVSPDASRLLVVDTMRDTVAVMDTESLEVVQEAAVPLSSAGRAPASAIVSADGRRLIVGGAGDGREIVVLDGGSLEVAERWRMPGRVSGFGLSPDGTRLYVALGDRVAMLDPRTGERLWEVPVAGAQSVHHVSTATG